MKTIKQVAEELGVSKQAVYKRLSGKLKDVCAPYVHTEHSKTLLSDEAVNIVKSDFLSSPYDAKPHTEHIRSTPECIQTAPEHSVCTPEQFDALNAENAKLKAENKELEHQVRQLQTENELLHQAIVDLKSDKADLQRHRDNLTAALTVSKTDLARLENIVMRISSLPLGKRVFGWSGAIEQITMQPDTGAANAVDIVEESTETDPE